MLGFLKKIFGTAQGRRLKRYSQIVKKVNEWETKYQSLSDKEILLKVEDLKKVIDDYVEKQKWIERANTFAERYFENDLRKMTYCLKDTDAWKTWVDLSREYVDVPWDKFFEVKDNTKVATTIACAGNSCQLDGL